MCEGMNRVWHRVVGADSPDRSPYQDGARIARPVVNAAETRPFSWRNESVLVLSLEPGIMDLARALSAQGASVAFRPPTHLRDIYLMPLEHYTIVLLPTQWDGLDCDITDIGGLVRRADDNLILVWASERFALSHLADDTMQRYCDIALSLPATAEQLALFLEPGKQDVPLRSSVSLSSVPE